MAHYHDLLFGRRLLPNEHAGGAGSHLLAVLIDRTPEAVLFGGLMLVVPLLGVANNLVGVIRLYSEKRVHSLAHGI